MLYDVSTRKTESCNTSKSAPWDCIVCWLGLCSALRMQSCSSTMKPHNFLKIWLLLYKINKTNLKLYSAHLMNIFGIFTHGKYHQLCLYSHLIKPNAETNVNYLGSPSEAAVRVMGKIHRILGRKIV